jgi:hypothetical protein
LEELRERYTEVGLSVRNVSLFELPAKRKHYLTYCAEEKRNHWP